MGFTGLCKYGLPKNAYQVMRSMRHIQFLHIDFSISDQSILVYKCKLVGNPTYTGKIRRYARKVLFSGVFATSSIFQDGGMVMDENGRNRGKWHLAQQLT